MEINRVSEKEYKKEVNEYLHVFQTMTFNELNKEKCDELLYFLFKDNKYRLGVILGAKNGALQSPFSAPMGGFSPISSNIKIEYLDQAIFSLRQWAEKNSYQSIEFYLPVEFYHPNFTAKQVNSLWRQGFKITDIDLNYAYFLNAFDDNYANKIKYSARKNLRIGLEANLKFQLCTDEESKQQAYDIIQQNRASKGFPLRMTWEQLSKTIKTVASDFFLVKEDKDVNIASAIVFHVAPKVVQVIYWGDIIEYSKYRTMNYLSFKVFEFYKKQDIDVVDLGISTVNSVPNPGLAEFKESIGCKVSPKYKFEYKI